MIGFTGLPPLSVSGIGLTSQVLKRRLPFLTHEQDGLTRRPLTDEMRGGSFSKRLVPGLNLKRTYNNITNIVDPCLTKTYGHLALMLNLS